MKIPKGGTRRLRAIMANVRKRYPTTFRIPTKSIVRFEGDIKEYLRGSSGKKVKSIQQRMRKRKWLPAVTVGRIRRVKSWPLKSRNIAKILFLDRDVKYSVLANRVNKDSKWLLMNGHHRLTAHERLNRKTIKARDMFRRDNVRTEVIRTLRKKRK